MDKRIGIMIPVEEFDDLIYAAREATIRFKRARTEFHKGNEAYSQWNVEDLNEKIEYYANIERRLVTQWNEATGMIWE